MAKRFCTYLFLLVASLIMMTDANAQMSFDNVIQIDGVIMTADSLRAVGSAVVMVKNQNRGVESENNGVFTMVCYKGDTLQFSCVGFRPKEYVVSKDLKGQYFSLIQLMVQDTFYLPETIVRSLPTKAGVDYAFQHWRVPDDKYEMARRNTDAYILRALAFTLPTGWTRKPGSLSKPADARCGILWPAEAYEHSQSTCMGRLLQCVETGRFQETE